MTMATIFHGDGAEAIRLEGALAAHCTCQFSESHFRTSTCAGHKALVEDQRFSDGLLWALHSADDLKAAEFKES
jgi:hypothetical protein